MVEINKEMIASTIYWLEILLDEHTGLTTEDKGRISTLLNFWRLYDSFLSNKQFRRCRVMLQAFLYGVVATAGVLVTYTVYDFLFDCVQRIHDAHARKVAQQNSKRRRHQSQALTVPIAQFCKAKKLYKNCRNLLQYNCKN